jgi:glycine dehydrogenase subunit 1
MDVANASMYDGSTAMAEAFLMAQRVTRREKFWSPKLFIPNIGSGQNLRSARRSTIETVHFDKESGRATIWKNSTIKCAALVIQSPNFFGCIEDLQALADKAHAVGALFIVVVDRSNFVRFIKIAGRMRRRYCRRRRSKFRHSL